MGFSAVAVGRSMDITGSLGQSWSGRKMRGGGREDRVRSTHVRNLQAGHLRLVVLRIGQVLFRMGESVTRERIITVKKVLKLCDEQNDPSRRRSRSTVDEAPPKH